MLAHIWAITVVLATLSFAEGEVSVFGPVLPPYFKLDRHCQQETRRAKVVGTSVAIVEKGQLRFTRAYGRRKKSEVTAVDTETAFQLGSTSKTVAATLFAIARKRGHITAETPVNVMGSRFPTIEARYLLNHTSGFKRIGWNWQIENGASREQLRNLFSKKEQLKPGEVFDYHNVAFSLIEEPLARAFSMGFDRAVTENLFKPLGMTRATVGMQGFKQQTNRAWPHEPNRKGIMTECEDYSFRYHETVPSAGGMNASINDMAQFLLLQLGLRPDVLSAQELADLHVPTTSAHDALKWFDGRIQGEYSCHYGLGFRILKYGDKLIAFHGGWLRGFTSIMAFSPQDQRGIVVLSNSESTFAFATAIDFLLGKFGDS